MLKKTSILAVAAMVLSCGLLAGCEGTTVVHNDYHEHHGWHHWHHHHYCHHHWC